MLPSSLTGLVIGLCFVAIGLLLRTVPMNNKWLFTVYTSEQKAEASRYLSKLFYLFGSLFCTLALLPELMNFRQLRVESFVILAGLAVSFMWRLAKKHVRQAAVTGRL